MSKNVLLRGENEGLFKVNIYVKYVNSRGQFHYTENFYREIHDRVIYGKMSRMDALRSLGINPDEIGRKSAKQATYRAIKMGKKLFVKDPSKYDPHVSIEEILTKFLNGEYDREDAISNIAACAVFETEIKKAGGSEIKAADAFISGKLREQLGFNKRQSLILFGVSKSAHYVREAAVREAAKEIPTSRSKRKLNDDIAKECILKVVKLCNGRVYGAKMLQYFIRWHRGERVNKKRIPRLLRELGLKVTPSNPYRGHDTHDHPCDAFTNLLVGRKFYVAPRAVILTDITYLYYSSNAKLIYKCSFIDAFTGEELGTAVSKNMDVSLVMKAYDDMILGHKDEIPDGAIIHSDQGSQFGSRKFRRSVKHDGFLQSMSNRGNSLDNSPMESFFGTFKDEVQLIDYETFAEAEKAVLDYKNFYNNVRPHTGISGWISTVFYDCCMGISNAVIPNEMDLQHAIDARIAQNKTERSKILEQKYQLTGGAEGQMDRDDEKLSGMIRKFRKSIAGTQKILAACPDAEFKKPCFVRRLKKNIASFEAEIQKLENIKGLLLKARDFYSNASIDVKIKLNDRRIWRNYPEMSYYKKMRGMFCFDCDIINTRLRFAVFTV